MAITVIGASNVDITGRPDGVFALRDSNIGRVNTAYGGVGRNIAHNCALLGLRILFISAVGGDEEGGRILAQLRAIGADTSACLISGQHQTGKYMAILDEAGDMVAAVNDMQVSSLLTAEYLSSLEIPPGLVAVDANLPLEAILMLAKLDKNRYQTFLEPVSAAKAAKLGAVCGGFSIIKPNVYEAEALTGISVRCEEDILRAGKELLKKGARRVYLTASERGVYAFKDKTVLHLIPQRTQAVNATGAGDAFSAGILYSCANGFSLRLSCEFAMACSYVALKSEKTVSPHMSRERIFDLIKEKRNEFLCEDQ